MRSGAAVFDQNLLGFIGISYLTFKAVQVLIEMRDGLFEHLTPRDYAHVLTVDYLAYGVYHGLLLAAAEVYQKRSAFYKRHRRKRGYRSLPWRCSWALRRTSAWRSRPRRSSARR